MKANELQINNFLQAPNVQFVTTAAAREHFLTKLTNLKIKSPTKTMDF